MTSTATILNLGHKGEGVVELDGHKVFVPLTLPGETVEIAVDGDRGTLMGVIKPAESRIEPFCPHFGACGGCQLQHMDRPSYEAFKIGLVETPLRFAGIEASVTRFIDAAGDGRRRASLHARREGAGYMRLRSHEVHDLDACPILVPGLARAPDITRAVFQAVGEADVSFVASLSGLDVAIRTEKKQARVERVAPLVARFKLARLALNGEMVLQAQPPIIEMGRARVELPIGGFLQATAAAENALAEYVLGALDRKTKTVADLFCGLGPFALRLAEQRPVTAFDADKPGIAALDHARRFTKGLREITAKARDLFRDPLTQFELNYDFVVLDPPRAGAEAQVRELAKSKVRTVVMIACDPRTFARDAAILIGGGYTMSDLVAVDQFAQSTHIEIAATFRR
ncbi:methyltransferase [Devosia neptuniae]|jgi:23S rRNA (uracil1939-C5)-methyltransferase|uniref:class I SAM-dependent RNA methyltransferase n=1 Tax=Devosia TaxID=46913 RepID=UPI0022B02B5F|nr:methyltransferase [Devosia neptuniae]MCZ4347863.1 methyltransferase [Devosia neptuniae]|tara:strand:+ start:5792 stop:6988 length:1197 start_codon:yes stop_codon:yes gene_type:complete